MNLLNSEDLTVRRPRGASFLSRPPFLFCVSGMFLGACLGACLGAWMDIYEHQHPVVGNTIPLHSLLAKNLPGICVTVGLLLAKKGISPKMLKNKKFKIVVLGIIPVLLTLLGGFLRDFFLYYYYVIKLSDGAVVKRMDSLDLPRTFWGFLCYLKQKVNGNYFYLMRFTEVLPVSVWWASHSKSRRFIREIRTMTR